MKEKVTYEKLVHVHKADPSQRLYSGDLQAAELVVQVDKRVATEHGAVMDPVGVTQYRCGIL